MKSHALVLPAGLLLLVIAVAQEPVRKAWKKRVLTTDFLTEGLSAGDLDGDGKTDLVAGAFWFKGPDFTEAKAYRPGRAMPVNSYMEDSFLSWVDDLDGDGDQDMITSMDGHGYGLAWFENSGTKESITFKRHEILPEDPAKTGADGLQFSQLHALESGDFDGDGRIDFITGKRYYAHNGKDPGAEDPALAVVFYNRLEGGKVTWKSEVIDSDSGVGCQVLAVDLDGDGMLEFAAGSKKGVHVIGR
jgi:hypothetical protein